MSATMPIKQPQRGIVSVEFALTFSIFWLILVMLLPFAQALWTYNVLHKAAYDAARYMASVPYYEMMHPDLALAASETAKKMVADAALAAHVDMLYPVTVNCNGTAPCGTTPAKPTSVTVRFDYPILLSASDTDFGATVTLPYTN